MKKCFFTIINDINLIINYFQGMNDMNKAVIFYKDVLHQDNMSIEAIACIGTHYFYTDQPEIALKFYRYCQIDLRNKLYFCM